MPFPLPFIPRLGVVLLFVIAGCHAPRTTAPSMHALATELVALATDDQRYEQLVMTSDPASRAPGFFAEKARRQEERAARCSEIFARIGMPTRATVGDEAVHSFWLIVQHADHDPAFQARVLEAMTPLVERGEIAASEVAYLTDRVLVNTGRPQRYGTQVAYDAATGRPYPRALETPAQLDVRRAEVGLEPQWVYMNGMAELHFRMNRALFEANGITEPFRYAEGFADWASTSTS